MVPVAGTIQTRGSKSWRSRGSLLGWSEATTSTRTVAWSDTDWRPSSMKYWKLVAPTASPGRVICTVCPSGLMASVASDPADVSHRADRQQPAGRRGVVVERVQDRGPARPCPQVVVLGLRRPAVAAVALLVVLVVVLVLRLEAEGVPVVEPGRLVGVDVPDVPRGAVVEHDLAPVGAEHQVRGLGGQRLRGRGTVAAGGDDGTGAAGPRAVRAVAEADRVGRVTPDVAGDRRHLAAGQVDREQGVAGGDQHRVGAGPRLLQHRAARHLGLGPPDHDQPSGRGVEHDGHRADRRQPDRIAEARPRQVLGAGRGELGLALLADRGQAVLDRRRGVDGAVEGDRKSGVLADRDDRGLVVRQRRDRRNPEDRVVPGGPEPARGGVEHGEAAARHADGRAGGDAGGVPERRHLRRVERHHHATAEVDPDDRRAVLDDVEARVRLGEDRAVELPDRLVDPAVGAVLVAGHPDAAVVELGPVGLVAVGLDGVGDDPAEGDRERDPGRQRHDSLRASALQVSPERHAGSLHWCAPSRHPPSST